MAAVQHCLYLCHPVKGDGKPETIAANLARARRWYNFLSARWPLVALNANWIIEVERGDECDAASREVGLQRDEAIARRMDGVVLVGGYVSTGMARERDAALAAGRLVIDLTFLGDEPPAGC